MALDAALLARAVQGRPVRVQWMRDDEHAWEPYGAAMVMNAKAADCTTAASSTGATTCGATRTPRGRAIRDGVNLLGAWYHGRSRMKMSPPRQIPQPAGGGDRNAMPLYEFPSQQIVQHLIPDMPMRVSALRTLGAYANVFASNRSWTSWRRRRAPIRSNSAWRI